MRNLFKSTASRKVISWLDKNRSRLDFFAALVVLGAVLAVLYITPFFQVNKFEVVNYKSDSFKYLDQVKVETFLKEKWHKDKILNLDTKKIEGELYEKFPFIERVYVSKHPPGKIKVEIVERTPFALIHDVDECALIDSQGYVLEIDKPELQLDIINPDPLACLDFSQTYSLPILTIALPTNGYKLGKKSDIIFLEEIGKIFKVFAAKNHTVSSINQDEAVFEVYNASGQKFKISLDEKGIDIQLKRFILVVDQLAIEKISFNEVDLRFDRPVVIPK